MQVTWTQFKGFVDTYKLPYFWVENLRKYELSLFLGDKEVHCGIHRTQEDFASDLADFEANYKSGGNKPAAKLTSALPDPDGHRFRGERCFIGVCPANSQTTFDFLVSEERYLTGFLYSTENHNWGDYISFSVVHPVAGVVEAFVSSWGICHGSHMIEVYKAKVPAGMKLRCVYMNVGANEAKFMANGFLHKRG